MMLSIASSHSRQSRLHVVAAFFAPSLMDDLHLIFLVSISRVSRMRWTKK
jgi:hypothetical protein